MWPFNQQSRRVWWGFNWSILFAVALSFALLFQACGSGDATNGSSAGQTGTAVEAAKDSTNGLTALDKEHSGDKPTPTPVAMAEPAVPVTGQEVTYATIAGQAVTGYLAQPKAPASETLPAILAIHEWWGLNDNIKATARRLAGEGYTVLAVDLYGGRVADAPEQAKDLMRSVMDAPGPAQENLTQAAQFLSSDYSAPKLGVIGWCFGGGWALRSGLLLQDLSAIAIYYGELILQPEALDGINAPIIGFFGEDDSSIPVQDVENFRSALSNLGKPADINLYPGVGHAFANPSGKNYSADAAEDAWKKTSAFFAAQLQG
ncbi:MAG: dienelactone hydrolase family protein [Phormidesmis sp.]